MLRILYLSALVSFLLMNTSYCREPVQGAHAEQFRQAMFTTTPTDWASPENFLRVELATPVADAIDARAFASPEQSWSFSTQPIQTNWNQPVIRGQSPGGAGGGAGAAAATDPSAILTQFQIQNIFTPSTYDASGYSNNLILQPVLPFPVAMPGLKDFFPNHIMRPTLPIISPTADPDGPLGVEGGLGDLTLLDAFIHPIEGFGNLILGYTALLPTSSDKQLGLGEWQFGPAAGLIYKEIPKTLLGFIYQQPFSLESQAQQILFQPILVRQLPDEWYVRWGELSWTFNTDNGDYNIPLNIALGKVCKIGQQPVNIFIQPFFTPEGLRQGPASEWGVKLNVTFLFPDIKFGPLLGHHHSLSDLID